MEKNLTHLTLLHDLKTMGFEVHNPNTTLYHYTDITGIKSILKNGTLRFSAPANLNDPFEMSLNLLDFSSKVKDMKAFVQSQFLRDGYAFEHAKYAIDAFNPKQLKDMYVDIYEQLKKNSGIFCMSKKNDSVLMWSHYGRKHTGACIGFKFLPVYTEGATAMFTFNVCYTENIVPMKILSVDSNEEWMKSFFYWIFTKSKHWEYEAEVRAILPDLFKLVNTNGALHYDLKYNYELFAEIYYGVAMPQEIIDELESIIIGQGIKLEKKEKMFIHKDKFELGISYLK